MTEDREADEWKEKAKRAEERAAKAGDNITAATWSEIARIYRHLANRREAWARAWKPRIRDVPNQDDKKDKPR